MMELMYLAHFGLKEAPFTITPDPRYLYMSERHREALAHLMYGVAEGGGFVQLTGEVGTGKTTLCRCLLEQLPPQVDVALVLNPLLTSLELLGTICDELGVAYPAGTTSLKVLVDALYRYLLEAHARGRRTVVVVDEAQDLSTEVLEQIRLLTNLETARDKLLQIVLIGQPELIQLLDREDLRQLAQRITARYHLEPFPEEDTRAYIRHRLQVAGRTRGIFTEKAIGKVHAESRGIPRLINVICDRALLGAYAHQTAHVDVRMAARAAAEVRGGRPASWRARWWSWATGAAVLSAVIVAGAVVIAPAQFRRSSPEAPRIPSNAVSQAPRETPMPRTMQASAALPAKPALGDLLSDPDVRTDQSAAFTTLYRRWAVDNVEMRGELGCEGGRAEGLRCLARTGSWSKLRRYNMPSILELVSSGGSRHYAAVTALDAGAVTLDLGERQVTFPLSEVEPFWDGAFILLWKPPALRTLLIAPGTRSKDVEWLRRRLAEVDGEPVVAKNLDLYDTVLKDRVTSFQMSRSLQPDGIAGEETIAHLTVALPGTDVPRLTAKER